VQLSVEELYVRLQVHEDHIEVNILFLKRPGTEVWMLM
jgi:hypothetical protein